jgi:uncharacterized membrane protein
MDEQEYRERLVHDAAIWRREGLITEQQEHALLARSGASAVATMRALRLGWFTTAVSLAGAIVLAAGVVLLFAANWEETPSWFRVGAIFAGVTAAYGLGYALIYRYNMQRVGSALILLGVLLYQAGLFLIAQIYNMPVDNPGPLLLLGAVSAFPLAYLFGSRIIMLLALADFTLGVVAELISRYPDSPKTQSVLIVIAALGIAFFAIGRLHTLRRDLEHFAEAYVFTGLLVLLGLVLVFTFDEPWSAMIDAGVESYAAPPVVYVSIAIVFVLVAAQWLLRPREIESNIDTGAQAALLALAAVVATWPGWAGYAIVFNAAYFAISAGLVTRGYLRGDERYINAGLLVVAIGLLTRYVDVFWSLLAGSAFFIIGGLLLLAVAFALERMRRGLVRAMSGAGETGPKGAPA